MRTRTNGLHAESDTDWTGNHTPKYRIRKSKWGGFFIQKRFLFFFWMTLKKYYNTWDWSPRKRIFETIVDAELYIEEDIEHDKKDQEDEPVVKQL